MALARFTEPRPDVALHAVDLVVLADLPGLRVGHHLVTRVPAEAVALGELDPDGRRGQQPDEAEGRQHDQLPPEVSLPEPPDPAGHAHHLRPPPSSGCHPARPPETVPGSAGPSGPMRSYRVPAQRCAIEATFASRVAPIDRPDVLRHDRPVPADEERLGEPQHTVARLQLPSRVRDARVLASPYCAWNAIAVGLRIARVDPEEDHPRSRHRRRPLPDRRFAPARCAPRGPEVQDDRLAAKSASAIEPSPCTRGKPERRRLRARTDPGRVRLRPSRGRPTSPRRQQRDQHHRGHDRPADAGSGGRFRRRPGRREVISHLHHGTGTRSAGLVRTTRRPSGPRTPGRRPRSGPR